MAPPNQTSRSFTLSSGAQFPAVGLGTWQSPPAQVEAAVEATLRGGYHHIDTASAYCNVTALGAGLRASGVPRGDVWLTTKLNNPDHRRSAAALDESLAWLGTDYVDLYPMHWPVSVRPDNRRACWDDWDFVYAWREMQALLRTGKVRNIGVSNYGIKNLERLLGDPSCKVVLAVNQIELQPCNPSQAGRYNASKGIHSTGHSCLGSTDSPPYKNDTLLSIAEAKGKTPQQVLLVWGKVFFGDDE